MAILVLGIGVPLLCFTLLLISVKLTGRVITKGIQDAMRANQCNTQESHTDFLPILKSVGSMGAELDALNKKLDESCDAIPRAVLRAVTGATNVRKGKIHELVCAMKLSGMYDTLIPLGSPVDFIGIKEDSVDFVEVKSGSSQLTNNERHLMQLIEEGKVRYIIVKQEQEVLETIAAILEDEWEEEADG